MWGTLICLVYKDLPIIGLADFPALNERWLGYRNNCFFNNSKFKSNHIFTNKISEATIGSTGPNLFSRNGKKKYMKYFNSTLVADFIINKTLGRNDKKKYLWHE